jgi:hypothetical protein
MRTKKITIEKGWYWTAGDGRWSADYSREGIGLNRELFMDSDIIVITVKGKGGSTEKYSLETKKGRDFIKANGSDGVIGKNRIGYVPKSILTKM